MSNGRLINSTETLDLWLNAYEYHRDDEKRAAFEALHDDKALPMSTRAPSSFTSCWIAHAPSWRSGTPSMRCAGTWWSRRFLGD
jgi:hypothetical protein